MDVVAAALVGATMSRACDCVIEAVRAMQAAGKLAMQPDSSAQDKQDHLDAVIRVSRIDLPPKRVPRRRPFNA